VQGKLFADNNKGKKIANENQLQIAYSPIKQKIPAYIKLAGINSML
jgi:hypothetical protein